MVQPSPQLDIRPSPIAGKWYPGDARQLSESVDALYQAVDSSPVEGRLLGVIAPHAGHIYSGSLAAKAFAALRGLSPGTIAIVGPMHHPTQVPLLTSGHAAYATPLGSVPVNVEAVNRLIALCPASIAAVRDDPEHSLEIELPFLQRALKTFSLVPIMIREQTLAVARQLAGALVQSLEAEQTVLVASSDLSHFYSQRDAQTLDSYMLNRIEAMDAEGVFRAEDEGLGFACGRAAIAAVLLACAALGANKVRVVGYGTSGDVSGDYKSVVGYGAAHILKV